MREALAETPDSGEVNLEDLKDLEGVVCAFAFAAEDLEDSDIYVVKVGSRRGELSYTRAQLEDANWLVSITIGDA